MRIKRTISRVPTLDPEHERRKHQPGDPPGPTAAPPGAVISPDTLRENRVPPGQARTRKWPILDASGPPKIDSETWSLEIYGLVERPLRISWSEFQDLPRTDVFADMHCVTRWSRLGNVWSGVLTRELELRAQPKNLATHVVAYGYDGSWSTNLPIRDFFAEDAILADVHDDLPITIEHGGPLRLVVPRLYAWKSAKWLKALEFVAGDRPGYWEAAGYHMHGDPWSEERFGSTWWQ